jgi:signal transduction histidine kinase
LAAAYFVVAAGLLYAIFTGTELSLLYKTLMVLTLPYFVLITVAAMRVLHKGHESAKFYLIAWAFLCTGAIIATLRAFDWVPTNVLTAYAIQIGTGLEMLFLSYALAYRIQSERARREFAQHEALDAKNAMVEALRASEEKLETLVAERTCQLEASLASEQKLHEQYVRFSAMISHEFRNPLNNIQAQADLLEREKKLGIDQFDRRLGVISSAIQQLALLFDRWMQSDRINNELALRNVQRVPTNEWVKDLVERYQGSAYQHPILFEAASSNAHVMADEALLQIAVINLLDNACKYSADNTSIKVRIRIEAQRIGIEVEDEGEGIDPAHHSAIFEEHFRVNMAHPRRGTGLGLAFVQRIAELHQGKVTLVSALGHGATFTLWLPR